MAIVHVLTCSLTSLILLQSFQGVESIDCYDCVSVAGSNLACEDEFKMDLSTYHLIHRDCHYTFFETSHCFKLKGIRHDGTHFVVRKCADADWGTNCGDIRYLFGDREERIQGCLVTCNYNGCNGAPRLRHNVFSSARLYLLVVVGLVIVRWA